MIDYSSREQQARPAIVQPEPPVDPIHDLLGLMPSPGAEFETSPSDVSIFEDCPRKWAWRAVEGVVPEKHRSAELGVKIHKIIERWLRSRQFDWAQEGAAVAGQIVRYLPPPQVVDPACIEMHVAIMLGGIKFNMTLDLFDGGRKPPKVWDHKSTSDFCWALPQEEMHDDVQVALYAAYGLRKTLAESVEVQWTYGRTRGAAAAEPVSRVLCGREITPRLDKTIETARTMREIYRTARSALDVVYDARACEKYGGCAFKSLCNLSDAEKMESIMTQGMTKASYIDNMRQRTENGAQGVNPPAYGQPAPAVVQPQYPTVSAAPPQYPQQPPQQQLQYPPQQPQPQAPQQFGPPPQQPQAPQQFGPPPQQPPPQGDFIAAMGGHPQGAPQPSQYGPPPQPQPQPQPQPPQQQPPPPAASTAPPLGGALLDKLKDRLPGAAQPAPSPQSALPSAQQRWVEFAGAALAGLTGQLPVADVQNRTADIAALCGQLADALNAEAGRRFGG